MLAKREFHFTKHWTSCVLVLMESICEYLSVEKNQESENSIMESDEVIDGSAAHFTLSKFFANG